MELHTFLGQARRCLLSSVARRRARLINSHPLISFTFDDFPKSALATGGAILKHTGVSGTYYTAAGLMGTTTELGPMFDQADLEILLEAGHELGSHTFSHVSARRMPLSGYYKEVLKGQQELARYGKGTVGLNFSYPFGHVTIRAKRRLSNMAPSCRSIHPGLNGPTVDLNLLRSNSLYGGVERLSFAQALIDENARQRTWLIFYTHDVQQHPSAYGCTPDFFEKVVRFAADSDAQIVTVAHALNQISPSEDGMFAAQFRPRSG